MDEPPPEYSENLPPEYSRQPRDTDIIITVSQSDSGNETEFCCDKYLSYLACCSCLFCWVTGLFALYYIKRKNNLLAEGDRIRAKTAYKIAIVFTCIIISDFPGFDWSCVLSNICSRINHYDYRSMRF